MLMSTQAYRYAHVLLAARRSAGMIPELPAAQALTIADGYDAAKCILDFRIAGGEQPIGRKIGFANHAHRRKYGVQTPIQAPIWAHLFDSTVHFSEDNKALHDLDGMLQPRIEPEIVFKLRHTPAPDANLRELADCIEWMAHALEVVAWPFAGWKFEAAEAIAAFGLHGALIVGQPKLLTQATRDNLAEILANASVSLSCDRSPQSAGYGGEVMNSPLHALYHLHRLLRAQPQFEPLTKGEIVSTGSWTDACPIARGQTWMTAFSGVALPGLSVSF